MVKTFSWYWGAMTGPSSLTQNFRASAPMRQWTVMVPLDRASTPLSLRGKVSTADFD